MIVTILDGPYHGFECRNFLAGANPASFFHSLGSLGVEKHNLRFVDFLFFLECHDELHLLRLDLELLPLELCILHHHLWVGEGRDFVRSWVDELDSLDAKGSEVAMFDFLEVVSRS